MRSNRKTRLHGLAIDFENNSITGESTVHEIYGILNILHTSDTIGKKFTEKTASWMIKQIITYNACTITKN